MRGDALVGSEEVHGHFLNKRVWARREGRVRGNDRGRKKAGVGGVVKTNGLGLIRKEILKFDCVLGGALEWRVGAELVGYFEVLEADCEGISCVENVF